MSKLSINSNKSKSISAKPKKINFSMPQEYVNQPTQINPRVVSVLKIEDKLIGQQVATRKKLESLKKSLEQEELREIRDKPKILEKSRILAQNAEKKMMKQDLEINEIKSTQNTEKVFSQVQPDLNNRSISKVNITVEKLFRSKSNLEPRKKSKSLLNLSVLERSEA